MATAGTITVRLLAQFADNPPTQVGTLTLDLLRTPEGVEVNMDRATSRRALKRALRRTARAI